MRSAIITVCRKVYFHQFVKFKIFGLVITALALLIPALGHAQIPGATLREQLKSLERLHGVDVRGLDRIGDEPARVTMGNLRGQVMVLLRDYNYVVLQSDDEDVRGVRILASHGMSRPEVNARQASQVAADDAAVQQAPEGRSDLEGQSLNVTLMGFGGREYDLAVMIAERSDVMVLPASMKAVLGFDGAPLDAGVAKTGNGEVEAELGLLPAVRVGSLAAENVDVAFVADDAVAGRPLLGQSFLKQFQVSYDRDNAQMILSPR